LYKTLGGHQSRFGRVRESHLHRDSISGASSP
jgi:hypothetical protein